MSGKHRALRSPDLSTSFSASIQHNDRLHTSLSTGIETDHRDIGEVSGPVESITSSLRFAFRKILSCGILYTAMVVTVPA